MKLIISCEHGGNQIPEQYKHLFVGGKKALNSHRGYDPGALDLYMELKSLADFSEKNEISRLLVEVNRSLGHPALFSEFTKNLDQIEKEKIISRYYLPYRNDIEQNIKEFIDSEEEVFHLSIHSFTPVLNGEKRNADVGLLYDPSRKAEKEFCKNFKNNLKNKGQDLKIRFNYPYLGTADGFTTYLRKKFQKNYIGVEIEVNQKFSDHNKMDPRLKHLFYDAVKKTIK